MAAIDKTYLSDYKVYKDFIDWAKNTTYECKNGTKIYVYDYVYDGYSEENMSRHSVPVMNSSQMLDYFLIKYCPFKFIQKRMREVYDKDYIDSILNGTCGYDTFDNAEIGKKYVFNKEFKEHSDTFITAIYRGWILLFDKDKLNLLIDKDSYGEMSVFVGRSKKALIRFLNKYNFPKETEIYLSNDGVVITVF